MLNNAPLHSSALVAIPSQTPPSTGAGLLSAANSSFSQAAQPSARLNSTQWSGPKRLTCARDLLASLLHRKKTASWGGIKKISCESVDLQTGKIDLGDSGGQVALAGEALSLLAEYLDLRQQHCHTQTGPLFIDSRSEEVKSLATQTLGCRAKKLRREVESNAANSAPADLKSLYLAAIASPNSIIVGDAHPPQNVPAGRGLPSAAAGEAASAEIESLAAEWLIELRNIPETQAVDEHLMPTPDPINLRPRKVMQQHFSGEGAPGRVLPPSPDWSSVPRDGMVSLLQRAGYRPIHALARSEDSAALQQHLGQIGATGLATPSPDQLRTPLHNAVESGQLDNVRQLLEAIRHSPNPAAINFVDAAGMTPLYLAGHLGQIDAFKMLLEAGGKMHSFGGHAPGLPEEAISALAQHLAERGHTENQRRQQLAQDQSKKRKLTELLVSTDRG